MRYGEAVSETAKNCDVDKKVMQRFDVRKINKNTYQTFK